VVTERAGEITILHTNDLHSHYEPSEAKWLQGASIGGFAAIDAHVRAVRARDGKDHVVVVDAGDLLTGTPLTTLRVDGAFGGAMTEMLGLVGYDAWTLGNHEFDRGLDNVLSLVRSSPVPVVETTLAGPDDPSTVKGAVPELILERAGLRVGILGAVTDDLPRLTPVGTMDRVHLLPTEETLVRRIRDLDPKTDVILLLSHMGVDADRALASHVQGIDLIVGGHSHTRMTRPEQVKGTWIVQAGSNGRTMGEVHITVRDDAIARLEDQVVDLVPGLDPGGPSSKVTALLADWKKTIDAEFGQPVGSVVVALEPAGSRECTFGQWVTDVLRKTTGADVAAYNAGGMRAPLPAGTVTRAQVFQAFPFGNAVVSFDVKGADLVSLALSNAKVLASGDGDYHPLSGLTFTWRMGAGGVELVETRVGGAVLLPDRDYRMGTTSYLADQWSSWLPNAPRNAQVLPLTDYDMALDAILRGQGIEPPLERAVRAE